MQGSKPRLLLFPLQVETQTRRCNWVAFNRIKIPFYLLDRITSVEDNKSFTPTLFTSDPSYLFITFERRFRVERTHKNGVYLSQISRRLNSSLRIFWTPSEDFLRRYKRKRQISESTTTIITTTMVITTRLTTYETMFTKLNQELNSFDSKNEVSGTTKVRSHGG